jgi:enoyl-CoA hydratase
MIELSRRGAVAVLTLARPPVNAIDDEMILALHRRLDELAASGDVQVLHIRSAQKAFAAGADLALIRSWKDAASPAGALAAYIDRLQGLYRRIEALPQVSLAEIGGAAMGGGYELALACDVRIAAEEAKIGLPEVGIGLLPGAGGTQRLTRLCGRGVASRVILTAEPVDGRTAASLGMVEMAVPRASLEEQARALADRLAAMPAHAQRAAKQCIAAADAALQHGYLLERELGSALLESNRTQRLISDFLERNAPK